MTQELSGQIIEIAHARRRFGYRRIHDLLRPDFPGVNHKKVYRLYSAANLAVRKRKKVNGRLANACRCNWRRASMRCGAWTLSVTA